MDKTLLLNGSQKEVNRLTVNKIEPTPVQEIKKAKNSSYRKRFLKWYYKNLA